MVGRTRGGFGHDGGDPSTVTSARLKSKCSIGSQSTELTKPSSWAIDSLTASMENCVKREDQSSE